MALPVNPSVHEERLAPATEGDAGELRRVTRALRTLSAGNRMLLRSSDEQGLLDGMCRVIVEAGGYGTAIVLYVKDDQDKTLLVKAYALPEHDPAAEDFFDNLELTWADTAVGRHATAVAIRTGKSVVGKNLLTDPDHAPWREDALKLGVASLSALPLSIEGEVIGVIGITAFEADAFDEAEVTLLSELADDLAYGIANLRMNIKRAEAQATIARLAYYDALTGLPNRALLRERLDEAIQSAKQQHRALALLHLKIGHFYEINTVLGYAQGDQLLRELSLRLGLLIKENELLAKVGEAEFALMLPEGGADYAIQVARRILAALHEPVAVSGLLVGARAYIGIALYPGHGAAPDILIQRSNAATHFAKREICGYAVYTGVKEQESTRRLALMGDLRRAIEQNELRLYCQPKVDIASRRVCGAEALVRWQHPRLGMVSTAEFIILAEQAGLITPLTNWVLEAAFQQSYDWHEAGLDLPLSINLSAHDLRDVNLIDRIQGLFSTWAGQPALIQFELTESMIMADPAGARETLTRLKQLGVKLFIDDFGTGYSSLSYLHKLPVDSIKIDQSFVKSIEKDRDSEVIVSSTIDLGHNLGLEVVAEGVESQEVWDRLADLGCDVAQGYLIGRPMPTADFRDWEYRWTNPKNQPAGVH